MKNYIKSQVFGLFWFVIIYALVRYLLAGPMSFQNWDTQAIVISVVVLVSLILRHFYSSRKALGLAASLFTVSLFVAALFNDVEIVQTISLGSIAIPAGKEFFQTIGLGIAIISLAYLIVMGFMLNNKRKRLAKPRADYIIWVLLSRMVLTLAIIFVIELYLVPLILVL